jgi:hypothetical protein
VFIKSSQGDVDLWAGKPDSQAAHNQLLTALQAAGTIFLAPTTALTDRRKGNLGEFIALTVGRANDLKACKVIAANAHNPLGDISRAALDLLWLFFGSNPGEDFGVVQEVKTTGDAALGYANRLISDYSKLFATDIQFTLNSRFGAAANIMEGLGVQSDLCCRARDLAGISPDTSPQIRLIPTLVHERKGAAPVPRLLAVKNTIVTAEGWKSSAVKCWSAALDDIEQRLARLSWGHA